MAPEEIEALEALAANTSAALSNAELFTSVAVRRERSYAILANIADGIVAVDRESQRRPLERGGRADHRRPGERRARAGRSKTSSSGRCPRRRPAGDRLVAIQRGTEEVWLSVTEAVMRDPAGVVAGRIFAFRDISADRLVEEMKSEFVATVSHELRGPLTSIYGFAETLLREDVLFGEEERRTFLRYIASESERLTSIVDALLNVARLDTGDLQVELAPTDVRTSSRRSSEASRSRPRTGTGSCSISRDTAGRAGRSRQAAPDPLGAARQRGQILAVRRNRHGCGPPKGRGSGSDVEDEGVGIPQSEQERIFRKFYRGGDASSGTGLGLFIAQGLVSAMGGQITVESEEGKGSQFTFDLPLAGGELGSGGTITGIAAESRERRRM